MFHFPVTIHEGTSSGQVNALVVNTLPLGPATDVGAVILSNDDGARPAGMYLFDGTRYRFCIPNIEISKAVIYGSVIDLYYALTSNVVVTGTVYKNGILFNSTTLVPGSIYGILHAGSSVAGVSSVNGIEGAINIEGSEGINVTTTGFTLQVSPGMLDEGEF